MRLIDADAYEKEMEKYYPKFWLTVLKKQPTAVPLVRCEECECWRELEHGTGTCSRFALDWLVTDATDFCSFAERRRR